MDILPHRIVVRSEKDCLRKAMSGQLELLTFLVPSAASILFLHTGVAGIFFGVVGTRAGICLAFSVLVPELESCLSDGLRRESMKPTEVFLGQTSLSALFKHVIPPLVVSRANVGG